MTVKKYTVEVEIEIDDEQYPMAVPDVIIDSALAHETIKGYRIIKEE